MQSVLCVSLTAINTDSACHTQSTSSESRQMRTLFTFHPILKCGFLFFTFKCCSNATPMQGWVPSIVVQIPLLTTIVASGNAFLLITSGTWTFHPQNENQGQSFYKNRSGYQPGSINQVFRFVFFCSPLPPPQPPLGVSSHLVTHVIIW